ncbi:ABC transporter substrate-binding protein [Streptomyces bambusae]|uniref:ABC transporter substrate-binding protein n=1 Tax=Streptomyces bambusae TaxID=1550616 RepID=UPI001CFC97E4|nr:ABC transporter substrate-binding protein [Streptomyces bambusae]MCB5164243.1 ABC transporter substrate-binding protein [Streptomyces bambusae]
MAVAGTWRFTDDRGVTAAGRRPLRVAAYVRAGAALADLGVRPVAVYGSGHDGAGLDPAKAGGLAAGTAYAGAGPALDERALRDAAPDLIVDVTYDGERAYALPDGVGERLDVPVVALSVAGDRPLDGILERFAGLAAALGAPAPAAGTELAAAEEAVRVAAGGAGPLRVLALSAAGGDRVHLARPATWPDLRRLAGLGVRLVGPEAGTGINWATGGWADTVALDADLVLADCRGSAAQPHDLAGVAGWRSLAGRAVVEAWNPEIPCSAVACAEFFVRVAEAVELLGAKRAG